MKPTVRADRSDGLRTRAAILRAAADLASVDGLGGLTIGRLATRLGMSKSGVFAHFGSIEELQLATIQLASDIYAAEIVQPALRQAPGIGRIVTLIDSFLSYSQRHVFPGGCFFAATLAEFDGRPGRLRDRLAQAHRDWIDTITMFLVQAQRAGDVQDDADVAQIAFEIAAALTSADIVFNLHDEPDALASGRRAALRGLDAVSTDQGADRRMR